MVVSSQFSVVSRHPFPVTGGTPVTNLASETQCRDPEVAPTIHINRAYKVSLPHEFFENEWL